MSLYNQTNGNERSAPDVKTKTGPYRIPGSDGRMPKRFIEDNEDGPRDELQITTTDANSEKSSSAELGVLALIFLLAWGILS